MGMETSYTVLKFIDRVRQNPAAAVAPEEIAALERAAREDLQGVHVATTAPVANHSEMSRKILPVASDSVTDVFDNLAWRCRIVGFLPTILLVSTGSDPTPLLPPMEAIDVQITLGRSKKEVLMDSRNLAQAEDPLVKRTSIANLPAISASIANRLWDLWLVDSPQSITFEYSWAVSASLRDTLAWGDVMISNTIFIQLLDPHERFGGGGSIRG